QVLRVCRRARQVVRVIDQDRARLALAYPIEQELHQRLSRLRAGEQQVIQSHAAAFKVIGVARARHVQNANGVFAPSPARGGGLGWGLGRVVLRVLRVLRTGEHTVGERQFAGSAVPTEQRQRPARDAADTVVESGEAGG